MMQTQRTLTEKKTSPRLLLVALVGLMLTTMLLSAYYPSLAFAQQQGPMTITATGVLVGPVDDGDEDPTPEFRLTDEATGRTLNLTSGFVDLEAYAGQRVTIEGVLVPGIDPNAYNVTSIVSADDSDGGGQPDGVQGTITSISGSAVLVEETPAAEESGDKGYFTVTDETEITKQQDGKQVAATFEDLEVGQIVEAAYAGAVAQSYPTQGNAESIAILEELTCMLPEGCDDPGDADKVTLSFELTVEGEPPAGATFLGFTTLESLMTTPLTDPDGDGIYTGSMTVPKFAPGGPPEPISLSTVRIVQGPPIGYTANGPEYRVIKDFGSVKLDGDKTLAASIFFDEDPAPEEISATGRIVEIADYPGASHVITDEESGVQYFLISDSVDLQDYAASGERVIVYGTPVSNQYTTDTILNVTRVEPADDPGEEVSATGVLERLEAEPVVVDGIEICELSTHAITDEATGRYYDLKSEAVDLDAYVDQRVTVYGESLASPAIGGAGAERCPDLDVSRIEQAGTPPPDNGGSDNGGSNNGGSGSSSGGSSGGVASGIRGLLPSTGGSMALTLLGAGILMTGGGLLLRRIFR